MTVFIVVYCFLINLFCKKSTTSSENRYLSKQFCLLKKDVSYLVKKITAGDVFSSGIYAIRIKSFPENRRYKCTYRGNCLF